MSDAGKLAPIEDFLRKSLLGEELVDTQFHLFSAKSVSSGRVIKPRVLCANNALLAKSSKYFLDLLSSDIKPADSDSLVDLTGDDDVPGSMQVDEYGYESDSDLELDEDPIPLHTRLSRTSPRHRGPPLPSNSRRSEQAKTTRMTSEDSFESAASGMSTKQQEIESVASSDTAVERMQIQMASVNDALVRLRSLKSRQIFIKDTAFQTWYVLLNYLYTGKVDFLPLSSRSAGSQPHPSSASSFGIPRCSAKSMYRLACKVGLDALRDEAFSFIRNNLTEHTILQELSCKLLSRHPALLEMELGVLYWNIALPTVREGFSALFQRIANGELPHGADIMIGILTRMLKELRPQPSRPRPLVVKLPISSPPSQGPSLSTPFTAPAPAPATSAASAQKAPSSTVSPFVPPVPSLPTSSAVATFTSPCMTGPPPTSSTFSFENAAPQPASSIPVSNLPFPFPVPAPRPDPAVIPSTAANPAPPGAPVLQPFAFTQNNRQ